MTNILVCDDDREIVDAIEIYLMQEGFGIVKAYDGEEAIEQLKKNDIKLMIIDIMMPKLDGIRATMKIREYSSIPILFLSAKSSAVYFVGCLASISALILSRSAWSSLS